VIVAEVTDEVIGFIAGHLTQRFACNGELEWINVFPEYRGKDVSSKLLTHLWKCFAAEKATKVCVNMEPQNSGARKFYAKHGAIELNSHWMVYVQLCAMAPHPNPKREAECVGEPLCSFLDLGIHEFGNDGGARTDRFVSAWTPAP